MFDGSELYAFADGGEVAWRARPLLGGYTYSLASAGAGARFAVMSKGVIEVEAADAVKAPYPAAAHGWRVTLNLKSLIN